MSFAEWKSAIDTVAATDPALQARCWNLGKETRIPAALAEFCTALAGRFRELRVRGGSAGDAAKAALDEMIEQIIEQINGTRPSAWLGLLPVPRTDGIPLTLVTHIGSESIRRFYARSGFDDDPEVIFDKPYMVAADGRPVRPFIWLTFETPEAGFDNDPTTMTRKLGLDHLGKAETLYRLEFTVDPNQLLIPTCFDAELRPAWAPPPADHGQPWGLTRDLETGAPVFPELLTRTEDHVAARPTAYLVSPPGEIRVIGPLRVDYQAGRVP